MCGPSDNNNAGIEEEAKNESLEVKNKRERKEKCKKHCARVRGVFLRPGINELRDQIHILLTAALAVLALFSLAGTPLNNWVLSWWPFGLLPWDPAGARTAFAAVLLVDAYLFRMLLIAARKAEVSPAHSDPFPGLPNRWPAVIMLFFFLLTLTFAFARLNQAVHLLPSLHTWGAVWDAAYVTFVRTVTLSHGEYTPVEPFIHAGRLLLIFQLLSGLLLLLLAFPVLTSRLAAFDSLQEVPILTVLKKQSPKNTWLELHFNQPPTDEKPAVNRIFKVDSLTWTFNGTDVRRKKAREHQRVSIDEEGTGTIENVNPEPPTPPADQNPNA